MFTIAARADVIALFLVLSVYVAVYRIRNLERVCVSESESECVKVRQHLRTNGNKTSSSLIIHRLRRKEPPRRREG